MKPARTLRHACIAVVLLATSAVAGAQDIEPAKVALAGIGADISATGLPPGDTATLIVAGNDPTRSTYTTRVNADGTARFADVIFDRSGRNEMLVRDMQGGEVTGSQRVIAGWLSILPPFLAIVLALAVRSVIPALVAGIWFGAMAIQGFTPLGALRGLLDGFQIYVTGSLADVDHITIILFSMMIGGMVGVITRVGGMSAIVRMIVSKARTAISGQVSIWAMGLVIFFDDYGNTLVVGNTARPLSDRLRISREKLAYIVDSTASPVACVAVATTWIGYQVGLIDDALVNIDGFDQSGYTVFLHSLMYSFYPFLAILFVLLVAATGRDFGPMLTAERKARGSGVDTTAPSAANEASNDEHLECKPGIEERALNALIPIAVLVVSLFVGLYLTGTAGLDEPAGLATILGEADPYKSLMWASLLGASSAILLAVGQRLMTLNECIDAWYAGVRIMLFTMIVLTLAWALADVSNDLSTADYLVSILGDALPLAVLPAVVFVLSAVTSFSTGTAWGTMGILIPLLVPLTWALMLDTGDPLAYSHILYSAIACNLAGSVFGDHCSPISDTTVLSSIASGCDHIEHVRTQLPYALLVGVVAVMFGTLPAGFGMPWWIGFAVGIAALVIALKVLGQPAERRSGPAPGATPAVAGSYADD
ncbi:MAG: Na+/H+ antiporter NhaC family protein [Pseudomonadota bacterium]